MRMGMHAMHAAGGSCGGGGGGGSEMSGGPPCYGLHASWGPLLATGAVCAALGALGAAALLQLQQPALRKQQHWQQQPQPQRGQQQGQECVQGQGQGRVLDVQTGQQLSGSAPATKSGASVRNFSEDEVLSEQLTRNVQFFGERPQQAIADAFVVVVGLGGVGSHAAHLLLRSGIGRLRLVDFDQVTLSSLNRHAVATRADVGMPKATCLKRHFEEMVPEADVEAVVEMYTPEKEDELLSGRPDYVIDAIDNLDTKAALVAACVQRGIKVLVSAGAGAKADPTRLRVVDLSEASIDPLSKAVRHKLRSEYGISGGVPVLLSLEKPRCKLVDHVGFDEDPTIDPLDFQVVPNFRVRTIPVLGTMPAIFGMACAAYVLCHLAGVPWSGEPVSQPLSKEYHRLLKELLEREEATFGDDCPPFQLDLDDAVYITRELWRGFSARHMKRTLAPGGQKGFTRKIANLTMARWDNARPPSVDNVVLLTHDEADAHAHTSMEELRAKEPEWVAWVEAVLDHARRTYFY